MNLEVQVFRDGQWITITHWHLTRRIDGEDELRTEHGAEILPPWRAIADSRIVAMRSANLADCIPVRVDPMVPSGYIEFHDDKGIQRRFPARD